MDAKHFDLLTTTVAATGTRRAVVRLLAALPLARLVTDPLAAGRAAANRRHRRTLRRRRGERREEVQDDRKKKKKRKKKKTLAPVSPPVSPPPPPTPPPPPCVPSACPANACGDLSDGCGGTLSCGCAGTSLCHAGVCQPCTVTCDAPDHTCDGTDLQAVLDDAGAGDTVYVCPGRYRGHFNIDTAVRVIGAGDGPTSESNTILDGDDAMQVLQIPFGTAGQVELERLRVTGGRAEAGAGLLFQGTMLRMTRCTVSGNTAVQTGAVGGGGVLVASGSTLVMLNCTVRANHVTGAFGGSGGIFTSGTVTLNNCLVADNDATDLGGGLWINGGTTTLAGTTQVRGNEAPQGAGIYVQSGALVIDETCQVTENTADPGEGGGIANFGTVTLLGANPSPIVFNNCHENCVGDVPGCSTDPPVLCPR